VWLSAPSLYRSQIGHAQWKQEMKKHFNETFHIYDSELINTLTRTFTRLEADNEINIWAQHNQMIVSMDALKPIETRQGWSKEKVEEYNKYRIENVLDADFDLLILDECHKVGGSTVTVGRYQMADILCNAIPNVLCYQLHPTGVKSDHFRRVLQLLDADAFTGEGMPQFLNWNPMLSERRNARQSITMAKNYSINDLPRKLRLNIIQSVIENNRHCTMRLPNTSFMGLTWHSKPKTLPMVS
jgi:hypothetical protein